MIDPLDRTETFVFRQNGLQVRDIHPDQSRILSKWGPSTNSDQVLNGSYLATDYLLLSKTNEVGAEEDYAYYATSELDYENRQLKDTTAQHFVDSSGNPTDSANLLITHYDYVHPSYGYATLSQAPQVAKVSTITVEPSAAAGQHRNLVTQFFYDTQFGRLVGSIDAVGNGTGMGLYATTDRRNGLVAYSITPNGWDALLHPIYYRILGNFDISNGSLKVELPFSGASPIPFDAVRIDRVGDIGGTINGGAADTFVIDNESSSGFATSGSVSSVSLSDSTTGLVGKTAGKLNSGSVASWTFSNLLPGKYRISVSIVNVASAATSATYNIYDGTTLSSTHPVADLNVTHDLASIFQNTLSVFTYDDAGNVISTTIDSLQVATAQFDPQGNATLTTDRTGVSNVGVFDVLGRQHSSSVDPIGSSPNLTTTYNYDTNGRLSSTVDPLGHTASLTYDLRGDVVTRTNPDNSATHSTYDAVGHLTSQTDELGRTTQFFYDNRDRLVQTLHPDGNSEFVQYDAVAHVTGKIDANGHRTQMTYDAMGHLVKTFQPDVTGSTSNYSQNSYDDLGRLSQINDFDGNITQYEYDNLNRVIRTRVLPLDGNKSALLLSTSEYDHNGNVIRSTTYDAASLKAALPPSTQLVIAADLLPLLDPANSNYAAARPFVHSVKTAYDTSNRRFKQFMWTRDYNRLFTVFGDANLRRYEHADHLRRRGSSPVHD